MVLIQFICSFLTLFSLFYKIKSDSDIINEQRQIASRPQLKNNLVRTLGKPVITTAITKDDEKFDDNELRKVFVPNLKEHENLEKGSYENDAFGVSTESKEINITLAPALDCLSCFSSAHSSNGKCFKGIAPTVKCNWGEVCYSELHPLYIKRGCAIEGRINRTFVCKCPLCNDKPSSDKSFYTYRSFDEWQLDNILLQKPLIGINIICKICDTHGGSGDDQKCRYGRNTDYTICGHGQICYINIDDIRFLVSRGCISRPVYNSWFHFCKEPLCNSDKYMNPKILTGSEIALSKIIPVLRSRSQYINETKLEEKQVNSKNILPFFRRQVEEQISGDLSIPTNIRDETHNDFISVLIKNVKEIYNELDTADNEASTTESYLNENSWSLIVTTTDNLAINYTKFADVLNDTSSDTNENSIDIDSVPIEFELVSNDTLNSTITSTDLDSSIIENTNEGVVLTSYKNVTLIPMSDSEIITLDSSTKAYETVKKNELEALSKKLLFYEKYRIQEERNLEAITHMNTTMFNIGYNEKSRSCIRCNNIDFENCNNPKNRLIPSTVCENADDVCYSMHTPFGVSDRGCFNINKNLTTYVCTCNLCNYITISEMPYIFAKKQEWIDNAVEISRSRSLRHSAMKEMRCLRCEANSTASNRNVLDVAACLAGSVESLPTEICGYNEVCAVKAIRKDGYIWRGCVKFPLYNYWWSLCDSDLCNYDAILSIYDTE